LIGLENLAFSHVNNDHSYLVTKLSLIMGYKSSCHSYVVAVLMTSCGLVRLVQPVDWPFRKIVPRRGETIGPICIPCAPLWGRCVRYFRTVNHFITVFNP
jgi:hypothetical protein